MKPLKIILAVLAAAVWISLSEFFRNQFLFNSMWIAHYQKLGLSFPETPINGILWGIWSLCLAFLIFFLSKKFTLAGTTLISWFAAFPMMWLTIGNLGVLPYGLIVYAIPLSLLESLVAALIIMSLTKSRNR